MDYPLHKRSRAPVNVLMFLLLIIFREALALRRTCVATDAKSPHDGTTRWCNVFFPSTTKVVFICVCVCVCVDEYTLCK